MILRFKIDESYIIRHKILEALFNEQERTNDCESSVGSIRVAEMTNIPIQKIHRYHEILKKDDEIECCSKMPGDMLSWKRNILKREEVTCGIITIIR